MTERERMLSGQLYDAGDETLTAARGRAKRLTWRYHQLDPTDWDSRTQILQELLGHLGEDSWIEPPFRCDYGTQISIGDHFFANYDCIFLDVAPITIGNRVMFGPRVCLYTAGTSPDGGQPGTPGWNLESRLLSEMTCGWGAMWWCFLGSPSVRVPLWRLDL